MSELESYFDATCCVVLCCVVLCGVVCRHAGTRAASWRRPTGCSSRTLASR